MIFCIGEGKYKSKGAGYQNNLQIFNKDVTEDEYSKAKSTLNVKNFKLPTAVWVDIKDIESPTTTQKQLGGYLKTLSYKDAWKEMWSKLSKDDKNFFKEFKNFDATIFKQITGIKVDDEINLSGKEVSVEIDGKKFTAIIK